MFGEEPFNRVENLSVEKRLDLFQQLQKLTLEEYLKQRGGYLSELKEAGVLGQFGDDGPITEYCQTHPYDPICQQPPSNGELRDEWTTFVAIRKLFVKKLEQQGLVNTGNDSSTADPLTQLTGIPSPELTRPGMVAECDPWDIECWFPGTFSEGGTTNESPDEQLHAILEYCQYYPEDPRCQVLISCPSPYRQSRSADAEGVATVQSILQTKAEGGGCTEVFEALAEFRNTD